MRTTFSILTALLAWVAVPITAGSIKYNATWASLDSRPLPTWYDDAKFGIFIHWGVYSVPAFGDVGKSYAEWYWSDLENNHNGVTAKFHNKTYGADYHYTSFVDQFKAELFDPDAWADLFVKSGAKYVVPTSKHHEGFTLWPSEQSWNWNAVDVGPHRDLLGDIMNSVRKAGLHAGAYFSIYEWFNPFYTGGTPKMYVDQVLVPQWYDLISTYKPDVLWCDGDWEQDSDFWESKPFLQWLYNDSPVADTIVINDRFGSGTRGKHGGFYTAEYSKDDWLTHKWEENSGIDVFSYGFNRATPEDRYFTTEYLLNLLVRTVSNNGNLLLDIGPAADGTIPTVMQQRLLEMGTWLSVNGEGIYSTRPWRVQQDGVIDATNIRYTYSPVTKATYAFMLKWPATNQVTFLAPITFNTTIVTLLGTQGTLKYQSSGIGLTLTLPSYNPSINPVKWIWCFKLENVL